MSKPHAQTKNAQANATKKTFISKSQPPLQHVPKSAHVPKRVVMVQKKKGTVAYVQPTPVIHGARKLPIRKISGKGDYELEGGGQHKKKKEQEHPWWEEVGRDVGGFLTKGAVTAIKALTGFGDYSVDTNSLLAQATDGKQGSTIPLMENSKVANIMRHREFIGNVRGSVLDFAAVSYDVNPGLDDTFPWGYALANCFTSYRMRGMVFEFISLSSEYTATPYMGFVAMASQYNVLDANFTNKKVMENSEYSGSTKPSKNLMHPIECANDQILNDHLTVRSGEPPANADKRMYDLCKFTIACGGQASSGIIGELWCSYEVEFYQPKLGGATGNLINAEHWVGTNSTAAFPLASPVVKAGSKIGGSIAGNTYTFPNSIAGGNYMISFTTQGPAAGNLASPTGTTLSGCSFVSTAFNGSFPSIYQVTNPNALNGTTFQIIRIKINSEGAFITLGNNGVYAATNTWDLYIMQVPDELQKIDRTSLIVDDETAAVIQAEEREKYIESMNFKKFGFIPQKKQQLVVEEQEDTSDEDSEEEDLKGKERKAYAAFLQSEYSHHKKRNTQASSGYSTPSGVPMGG